MKNTQASAVLSFAYVFACALLAPGPTTATDDWPAIPKDELEMKRSPAGAGAPAVILYREVITDDNKNFETHYVRIKVFTDEGQEYGDVEIPYVEKRMKVEDIHARTVRPDGTSIEFQGQVYDKIVAKAKGIKIETKAFSLPEVSAGSIIEYSYRLHWREGQPDILKHPEALAYIIQRAYAIPAASWTIQRELFTRRARFAIRPLPSARVEWIGKNLPEGVVPQRQADGTIELVVSNVPAFQKEEYIPPEDELKARVDFFYLLGYGSFWSQQADLRAEALEKFIGKGSYIKQAVAAITDPNDSPETKLRKLYARVQKLRNLSYEHRRTEKEQKREKLEENKSAEDVLRRGYGRGNEINYLFVALARAAGLDASVVEVSARNRRFFIPELPDLDQLSAGVVAVQVGGRKVFLDPATKLCPYGLVPWEETGTKGIVLVRGGGLIETPRPKSDEAILERRAQLHLDASGALEGTVQVLFRGQEALDRRREEFDEDEAGRRKDLEETFKQQVPAGATVELVKVTGWEDNEEPLAAEFKVRIPEAAEALGRRLILSLAVFHAERTHPFYHGERKHPVYFRYPFQEIDEITVQLPEGYEVESLPTPRHSEESFGRFGIAAESLAGAVRLKRRYVMDEYLFGARLYGLLLSFLNSVQAGDEEPTVLRKMPK